MQLLCDPSRKAVLDSLYSDTEKTFPAPSAGEAIPLAVAIVDRLVQLGGTRYWQPRDLTGYGVSAVLSTISAPLAGVFNITYTAVDLTEQTTADLPYNATPEEVEEALNDLPKITAAGGVTVSGSDGFFIVSFLNNGAQHTLEFGVDNLAPDSIAEVGILVDGTADKKEIQQFRLLRDVAAGTNLTTFSYDPESTVAAISLTEQVLDVGGVGVNHKVRMSFLQSVYDGKWTLTVGGDETDLIAYDAEEETVQEELEALASVGTGNVTVKKERFGVYVIAFKGDHAEEDMGTIAGSSSGLLAIPHLRGELDLRTSGIALLLGNDDSVEAILEVEVIPPGGTPKKVCRKKLTLVNAIKNPNSLGVPVTVNPVGMDSYPSVDEYEGGDAITDLDAQPTLGVLAPGAIRLFVHNADGLVGFQLTSSTDVTSSPDKIRPLDFHITNNPVVWYRVS